MPFNYYQNQYQPFQQTSTGINWVQGEAGARSWAIAPNTTILLMDSETQRFFIKQSDQTGMPLPLRVFEYKEVSQTPQNANLPMGGESVEYITKQEFEQRISALKGELNESSIRTAAKKSAE